MLCHYDVWFKLVAPDIHVGLLLFASSSIYQFPM
jgi:hypothetical protein